MKSPSHAVRRVATFEEWLDNAKPKDHFIYHKGQLGVDRGPEEAREPYVNNIAIVAWHAHLAGLVTLVQQRIGRFNWNYIAIRKGASR